MARLRLEGVTRHFRHARTPAVAEVDLDVADGEVVLVTGGAGSGKTTLLRLAAGLELPDRGRVLVGEGAGTGPEAAQVALVFQNYAIYPHLSVRQNIALPLRREGRKRREVVRLVRDAVRLLGLDELSRRPATSLSTSERMRVALARSVVRRPDVLLMDEPLANLEPGVRAELRTQLVAAQEAFGTTTLCVLSDSEDLTALPGRVVRLEDGRLVTDC